MVSRVGRISKDFPLPRPWHREAGTLHSQAVPVTQYLFDTHHATALWRRHQALVNRVQMTPEAEFFLCVPCVGELWYRVHDSSRALEGGKSLGEFITRFPVLEFDLAAAVEFGRIKTALRRIGRPISEVDAQIASIARSRDMVVLTAEQHFSVVTGLRVERWLTVSP